MKREGLLRRRAKGRGLIYFHASGHHPVAMLELAFYPAVALLYFFGVMKASQDDRVELNDGASVNVFCLFVLVQPLCLVLAGYTGMATYLLTALVSYNFLPWRKTKRSKKTKKEE